MIRPYLKPFACLLIPFFLFFFPVTTTAQAAWAPYLNTDNGYEVQLPGKPNINVSSQKMMGNEYPMTVVSTGLSPDFVCIVVSMGFPSLAVAEMNKMVRTGEDTAFVRQFVEGLAKGAGMAVDQIKVTDQGQVRAGNVEGRQFLFQMAETPVPTRVYVDGTNLHVFLIMGRTEKDKETATYFDSVKFTGVTKSAPPADVCASGGEAKSPAPGDQSASNDTNIPNTRRVTVGALLELAIQQEKPVYPESARSAGIQGVVQVAITVSEDGCVIAAEAVAGHPLLRGAAVAAARKWRFKPSEIRNRRVKVQGVLTFNFSPQ